MWESEVIKMLQKKFIHNNQVSKKIILFVLIAFWQEIYPGGRFVLPATKR